jgi:hypothetical protein
MILYRMKMSCSTQPWFDKKIYTLVDIDDNITPFGKDATWRNLLTCEERRLFFDIMEPISDSESIAIIREIRLEQIGI